MDPSGCTHLDEIRDVSPSTPQGCEECLRSGGRWVSLRMCLTCGHVGCCDSSQGHHATQHFHASGHPLSRSLGPGEVQLWCYVDRVMVHPGEVEDRLHPRRAPGLSPYA